MRTEGGAGWWIEEDGPGIEVRLQVHQGGAWELHTGDPCFDQDHIGAWGAGWLPWERSNLTELARDLVEQVNDDEAQS